MNFEVIKLENNIYTLRNTITDEIVNIKREYIRRRFKPGTIITEVSTDIWQSVE